MTDKKPSDNPLVYLLRQNGKHVGICLSTVAKWLAGIAATVIGSTIIGVGTFAFWSVSTLSRLESTIIHTAITVDKLDKKVSADATTDTERLDRFDERLRALEKGSGV